jgi:hypothetical protein
MHKQQEVTAKLILLCLSAAVAFGAVMIALMKWLT